jgi:hypothetical protein
MDFSPWLLGAMKFNGKSVFLFTFHPSHLAWWPQMGGASSLTLKQKIHFFQAYYT